MSCALEATISSKRKKIDSVSTERTGAGTAAGCSDFSISEAALRCLANSMLRSKPYSENTRKALVPDKTSKPNSVLMDAGSKTGAAPPPLFASAADAVAADEALLSVTGANGYPKNEEKVSTK